MSIEPAPAPALEWLELGPPSDPYDEPGLSLIARYIEVANTIAHDYWGDATDDTTMEEMLAGLAHDEDEIVRRFLIVESGRDVARAVAVINREEGASVGSVRLGVVPAARGRGIGRAVAERIEHVAQQLGASSLQAWVEHRTPASGEGLVPASGHGAIASDPAAQLAISLGYALEQVDRISTLEVPAAAAQLERHRADALVHAGGQYVLRSWRGATPPELLETMAVLHGRMVTDAPTAGLEVDEEHWDAARLQRVEARVIASGLTMLQTAAVHGASGRAVAFTILALPAEGRPAFQEDTLVHSEHRGHRLGMLVKAENLLQLRRLDPERSRVVTWNAEENRPMLRVNEALGFTARGAEGAWQKRVAPPSSVEERPQAASRDHPAAPDTMGA